TRWEFGYAVGGSRILASARRSPAPCAARASLEALKCESPQLWPQRHIPLRRIARHLGPCPGPELRFSPNFGLNGNSNGLLSGFKLSDEIEQFLSQVKAALQL